MASPWKFLTRLVLPRRQERQENGSIHDVTADVSAIAEPTKRTADKGLSTANPAIEEEPIAHDQSEVVSAAPALSEAAASAVDGATDVAGATFLKAVDPILSDEANMAARDGRKLPWISEAATRKRSKRAKKAETIDPPPSPAAGFDEAISLDEEIRLLRNQLARKLQLQNAQLNRMLERFER